MLDKLSQIKILLHLLFILTCADSSVSNRQTADLVGLQTWIVYKASNAQSTITVCSGHFITGLCTYKQTGKQTDQNLNNR